ncbi:MAG: helix-turn-helix domain-containing protein [Deltaproteobacteria bacterium]|nr:helix-turn-helix domain-containing protein [Deltaproteobacteria bacterium]
MATKNIDFTNRLKLAIKKTGLKNPAFADKAEMGYSTLMNYLKRGAEGHVPEWDQLVKIAIAANCSIDWLLTGKEADLPEHTFVCTDERLFELCEEIMELFEEEDEEIIQAIKSRVQDIRKLAAKNRENRELKERIKRIEKYMEEILSAGPKPGTERAAATGKK